MIRGRLLECFWFSNFKLWNDNTFLSYITLICWFNHLPAIILLCIFNISKTISDIARKSKLLSPKQAPLPVLYWLNTFFAECLVTAITYIFSFQFSEKFLSRSTLFSVVFSKKPWGICSTLYLLSVRSFHLISLLFLIRNMSGD